MMNVIRLDKEDALDLIKGSKPLDESYHGTLVRVGHNERYGDYTLLDGPHEDVVVFYKES